MPNVYINAINKRIVLRFIWVLVGRTCDSNSRWPVASDVDQTQAFAENEKKQLWNIFL